MKYAILFILFISLYSCNKKNFKKEITGQVWNRAENAGFAGAHLELREYDNAFEANSKTIATAVTDANGNFHLNTKLNKNRSYKLYIDNDLTDIAPTGLYEGQFNESVMINTSNSNQTVDLIAATPSYYTYSLIHDLGSDSMYYEGRHQHINFVGSATYTNEEYQTEELVTLSGNWIFKKVIYNNGISTMEIDTIYYTPYQSQNIEVHY